MTPRQLLKQISANEWWLVAVMSIIAVILTSLPPLHGLYLAYVRGSVWNGRQFMSAGDFNVYLSFIEQVKQGHWLFDNLFTTEKMAATLNVFWLGVGALAAALRLSPLAAFHLVRILLIPPLAAVAYALIACFFSERRRRILAAALFLFGSGVGIYLAPLFPAVTAGPRYEWPIDLWVAESNAFLSMLYSPHFIASLTLMLLAFLLLLCAFTSGRLRYALYAGLTGLLLFQFHPFHVPLLYAVPAVWLAWRQYRRSVGWRHWLAYALFVAVSLPAAAYHLYWTSADPASAALVKANLTLTPSVWHLVFGLGAVSVLAVFGYRRGPGAADAEGLWDFLAVWALVQLLLVYVPVPFQRRLVEGIQFPLVVLSVPALLRLYGRFWRRFPSGRLFRYSVSLILASVIFLPSTFSALYRGSRVYTLDPLPRFFHSRNQAAALAWLKSAVPADAAIMASLESGNVIPGWSARRVYAGHWVYSVDLSRKAADILWFFGAASDAERLRFAREKGLDHVFCGPTERALGGCPSAGALFIPVFRSGNVTIYQVADSG